MLVEEFVRQATGREGCSEAVRELLEGTAHLIKARSVATGASQCIFMARLGETMGVRGFYHSVLPGKGEATHLVLALAFPKALRELGAGTAPDFEGLASEALRDLIGEGIIDKGKELSAGNDDFEKKVVETAAQLMKSASDFVVEVFDELVGDGLSALRRARILVENHLMSYKLHIWGVPDVVVEDPQERAAVVVEWKSFAKKEGSTPQVYPSEVAQAYVYAMLEAERLGLAETFEEFVEAILGRSLDGEGARVIPAVVRPTYSKRAMGNVVVRHPRFCRGVKSRSSCERQQLYELMAKIVLAAEHLVLSVTDIKAHLSNAGVLERLCTVRVKGGAPRPVFRRVPYLQSGSGSVIRLPMGNPRNDKWPCKMCPDNVKDACLYFISHGLDREYADFKAFQKEAWRARFAVYKHRENALMPFKLFYELSKRFGGTDWIRGHLDTRVLEDGSRIDLFDEARVRGDEVELLRPPLKWEVEERHLITVREGKPVALFFNESHVSSPLLRLNVHGTVSEVKYDPEIDKVVVRVSPANKLSMIYPLILRDHEKEAPEAFRDVVALEANVELTQLELLGITAAEMSTVKRGARALEKEELEEKDLMALLFAGVKLG
ncbi:MAG: hypothetical protein GXO07_00620 [Crenarchaeota archaeon]|nr:hypothetical protein [Thermoproteota archaeon]